MIIGPIVYFICFLNKLLYIFNIFLVIVKVYIFQTAQVIESISMIKLQADNMNGTTDVKISVAPIYPVKTCDTNATTTTVSKIVLVTI